MHFDYESEEKYSFNLMKGNEESHKISCICIIGVMRKDYTSTRTYEKRIVLINIQSEVFPVEAIIWNPCIVVLNVIGLLEV